MEPSVTTSKPKTNLVPRFLLYGYQLTKKGLRVVKVGAVWQNISHDGKPYGAVKFDNLRLMLKSNKNYVKQNKENKEVETNDQTKEQGA